MMQFSDHGKVQLLGSGQEGHARVDWPAAVDTFKNDLIICLHSFNTDDSVIR